jgi:hypothetical protein
MSPEMRTFLDDVREAEDPTSEDQRRVLLRVHTALAAGALGAGSLGSAKLTQGLSSLLGLKFGALVCLAGMATADSDALVSKVEVARLVSGPFATATQTLQSVAAGSTVPAASPASEVLPLADKPAPVRPAMSRPSPSSLRQELEVLADVQAALRRGDGRAALTRLDGHVTSDTQLLAERQAARVLALCLLGQELEARRAAVNFAAQHPSSPQLATLERSCAFDNRPAPR